MVILAWIIVGGLVGLVVRAVIPERRPMGWAAMVTLGVAGSCIGGAATSFFFGGGPLDVFGGGPLDAIEPAGWAGSVVGALVALSLFALVTRSAA